MAWLLPSDNGMIVPKWHWQNCSHFILARSFPSAIATIVSEKTLARLFPSDRHYHDCSQVDFDFLICILFCTLFFGTNFHQWVSVENICAIYQYYGTWSNKRTKYFILPSSFLQFLGSNDLKRWHVAKKNWNLKS